VVCGAPANHSQRLVASGDRVLVGEKEAYEPRCRLHFEPPGAAAPVVSRPKSEKHSEPAPSPDADETVGQP